MSSTTPELIIKHAIRNSLPVYNSKVNEKKNFNRKISRGILNSEGLAFCAFADFYKSEMIIESGVCNAGSTIIWGKYFSNIPIVGIDTNISAAAAIRTCIYSNVVLLEGDGRKIVIDLIRQFSDKKISVFIDGPKNEQAIRLAEKCFGFDNVKMVGIHDVFRYLYGKPTECRKIFDVVKLPNNGVKFCTDEEWFIDECGYMDVDNDGSKYVVPEKYGKYGPGIGFFLK
jgi:hypothetical protein